MTPFHVMSIRQMVLNRPNRKTASEWLTYPASMTTAIGLHYWLTYQFGQRLSLKEMIENMYYDSFFPSFSINPPDYILEMGELGPV